jgi:hypothetical protein
VGRDHRSVWHGKNLRRLRRLGVQLQLAMAQRGKPSTAHEYDKTGACIYCGMYRNCVEQMAHVCTVKREAEEDAKDNHGK